MAGNLTTRWLYKQYAGIVQDDTTDNAIIDRLILQVAAAVEEATDRTFLETTYKTWLDGSGEQRMLLREWPIRALYKATGSVANVIEAQYTGSGFHADVTVDSTNVVLHNLTAAGAEATTNVAIATYGTVTLLAAEITATTDWTGTVLNSLGAYPTTLLRPMQAQGALSTEKATLSIPEKDGDSVQIVAGTDRLIERTLKGVFAAGRSNIFAWYTAGYTLPEDKPGHGSLSTEGNLPQGLILAVNRIIKDTKAAIVIDGNFKGERIGDYAYTKDATIEAVNRHWKEIEPYSRIEV